MNVSRFPTFSPRSLRIAAIGTLLLVPALTLWNIAAENWAPRYEIVIGPPLRGVTETHEPVEWNFHSLVDGSLQKAIANAVSEAIPARPFLVRLNNSFRKRLYGLYGAPGIVAGADGQLIEVGYLREYCARDLNILRAETTKWIPRLRALQEYFDRSGRQFVYFSSPSKAAYMPDKFLDFYPCISPEKDRREYLPLYRDLLSAGGVRYIDAAAMTHSLHGRYDVDLFPLGGVHWNQLGVAHAADAILERINAQAGREIAPRLRWTYEVTDRPTGTDTDLVDVVNAAFGRPRYPVPKLTFADGKPCEAWPVSQMNIALVGGSFVHDVARMLIEHGCMRRLNSFNYLIGGMRGGIDYEVLRRQSSPEQLKTLRDVDILILEENEGGLPGMRHAQRLADIVLGE